MLNELINQFTQRTHSATLVEVVSIAEAIEVVAFHSDFLYTQYILPVISSQRSGGISLKHSLSPASCGRIVEVDSQV